MDNAIEIDSLSKQYRIGVRESMPDTLVGQFQNFVTAPLRNYRQLRRLSRTAGDEDPAVVWALREVSVSIPAGQVMGIIGANGAGKSTLLKILAKITQPTSGEAKLRGRIGSLLEVGTGFHPELTGRENIYLNGTILGMRKREIDRRFDEIVDFSELEQFVDTPVKRYSSGMRVRLAFSVAAHLEPEILLVDEVLAVGDLKFQRKSLGKIEDVSSRGRTVLFVSHQLSMITQLCHQCMLLSKGQLSYIGKASETVSRYSLLTSSPGDAKEGGGGTESGVRVVRINGRDSARLEEIPNDRDVVIELVLTLAKGSPASRLILLVEDSNGTLVIHHTFSCDGFKRGANSLRAVIPPLYLLPGVYGLYFKFLSPNLVEKREWRLTSDLCLLHFSADMQSYGKKTPILAPDVSWELVSRS